MGVTVANSLMESLKKNPSLPNLQIVILEGDNNGGGGMPQFNQNQDSPEWKAATARNANTISVGASMHVFSTRKTVYSLLSNGIQDAMESLQQQLFSRSSIKNTATTTNHPNPELFAKPPPFFAFKPYYCLGPAAAWNERLAFINYGLHYWYTALVKGGQQDAAARAKILVQLAKATRHKFVTEIAPEYESASSSSNWYSEGLLSVHRTKQDAQEVLDECQEFGVPAQKLSWEEAIQREPRLQNLPFDNDSLHVVLRTNDIAANCEEYTRLLLDKCQQQHGVQVENSQGKVTRIDHHADTSSYTILQEETGTSTQVDVVVLAAGSETPLLAQSLGMGIANHVPTYPLRGFSYTVVTTTTTTQQQQQQQQQQSNEQHANNNNSNWLLQSAICMDNLYMSSVKPWMARLTGFGELAGFPKQLEVQAASSQAPRVLHQYAQALFGDMTQEEDKKIHNIALETAIPCFRPMSPDDLPMVGSLGIGKNKKNKGLFVHTGHGTLGWTTAFATADCCAQDIIDYLLVKDEDDGEATTEKKAYILPDGTKLDRNLISPSRFGWFGS
mmetsp:Transcript_1593/g.3270  ORF Transcript_1593/g.3270 Transcript_1593/m.3270 type:complete len:558 (+) Transcript_1593:168-1841(+)